MIMLMWTHVITSSVASFLLWFCPELVEDIILSSQIYVSGLISLFISFVSDLITLFISFVLHFPCFRPDLPFISFISILQSSSYCGACGIDQPPLEMAFSRPSGQLPTSSVCARVFHKAPLFLCVRVCIRVSVSITRCRLSFVSVYVFLSIRAFYTAPASYL